MILMYYVIKTMVFASILSSLVKFRLLQNLKLLLALLYTGLVAILSYIFLIAPDPLALTWFWKYWLVANFVLTYLYFWLIVRSRDSGLFWALLPVAPVVVLNEPNLVPFWLRMIDPSLVPRYLRWIGMGG